MSDKHPTISVETAEASDSWGFVGIVRLGGIEAYRTIRNYPSPGAAHAAALQLLVSAIGILLASQEWGGAADEFGHPPHRVELGLGFRLGLPPREDPATEAGG